MCMYYFYLGLKTANERMTAYFFILIFYNIINPFGYSRFCDIVGFVVFTVDIFLFLSPSGGSNPTGYLLSLNQPNLTLNNQKLL